MDGRTDVNNNKNNRWSKKKCEISKIVETSKFPSSSQFLDRLKPEEDDKIETQKIDEKKDMYESQE